MRYGLAARNERQVQSPTGNGPSLRRTSARSTIKEGSCYLALRLCERRY